DSWPVSMKVLAPSGELIDSAVALPPKDVDAYAWFMAGMTTPVTKIIAVSVVAIDSPRFVRLFLIIITS
ncbi:MAG TPA: hypothetical protein VFM64_03750, partial [Candidatus Nitrosotenuis sp.]|nr:hypothetical protein [Candidatus Nitrosotenuis sp.]